MATRLNTILRHLAGAGTTRVDRMNELETRFLSLTDRRSAAISFDHGRTAMYAVLKSLGVGASDEIVLSAYTCHSVPQTVRAMGAKTSYVDIDSSTYGPRPDLVERAITPRTKAILVQHSYGWPADVQAIVEIGQRHGVAVIEDCCQTLGARIGDRPVGTFGIAAFYSFQWNKPISAGSGGMAVVHDPALAARVRAFRDERSRPAGFVKRKLLAAELLAFEMLMYPRSAALLTRVFRGLSRVLPMPGGSDSPAGDVRAAEALEHPAALTGVQADLIRLEAARPEGAVAHRRGVADRMRGALLEMGYDVLREPAGQYVVPLRLPMRVRDPLAAIAAARKYDFELTAWFDVPLDPLAGFRAESDYAAGQCPECERAAREVVLIPTGQRITPRVEWRMERFFRCVHDGQVTQVPFKHSSARRV